MFRFRTRYSFRVFHHFLAFVFAVLLIISPASSPANAQSIIGDAFDAISDGVGELWDSLSPNGGDDGSGSSSVPSPDDFQCANGFYTVTMRFTHAEAPEDGWPFVVERPGIAGPVLGIRIEDFFGSDRAVLVFGDPPTETGVVTAGPMGSANIIDVEETSGISECVPPSSPPPTLPPNPYIDGPTAGEDGGQLPPGVGDGSDPDTDPDGDADGDGVPNGEDYDPYDPNTDSPPPTDPTPNPSPSPNPQNPDDAPPSACEAVTTVSNPFSYAFTRLSDKFPFDFMGDFEAQNAPACPTISFFGESLEFCFVVQFMTALKYVVWIGLAVKVLFAF